LRDRAVDVAERERHLRGVDQRPQYPIVGAGSAADAQRLTDQPTSLDHSTGNQSRNRKVGDAARMAFLLVPSGQQPGCLD
jgi:hypothetical protein